MNSDYQIGSPELQIIPDRDRATELGVSISDLGSTVSALIGGSTVGKFTSQGRRLDIRMRLLADQRSRPEDLSLVQIRTGTGALVPLSLLTTQQEQPVLQTISHLDRERAISISGNVGPGHSQAEAMAKVMDLGNALPQAVHVVATGQASQLDETTKGLWFALGIGILVAYMVLASQFNSFLHPITVLTILPLAVAGAVMGLVVSGKSLNLFSMIGLLLLMGIVKKNAILLVEYANQVREHEPALDALESMKKAGPLRLRPILMTTVATMMSAVPPLLGLGPGTETRSPMAAAVLGRAHRLDGAELDRRAGVLRRHRPSQGPAGRVPVPEEGRPGRPRRRELRPPARASRCGGAQRFKTSATSVRRNPCGKRAK